MEEQIRAGLRPDCQPSADDVAPTVALEYDPNANSGDEGEQVRGNRHTCSTIGECRTISFLFQDDEDFQRGVKRERQDGTSVADLVSCCINCSNIFSKTNKHSHPGTIFKKNVVVTTNVVTISRSNYNVGIAMEMFVVNLLKPYPLFNF